MTPSQFEKLVRDERKGLLGYACYRLGNPDDAEDVVQDVLVQFHQQVNERNVEIRRPQAWLYRTLANLCISRLRESERIPIVPLDGQPEPVTSETEDFELEFRRISRLLGEIPAEQAEVIRLRFYGDKSFREIADILGIPLTTAKSRFSYGLEKIRQGMHAPLAV